MEIFDEQISLLYVDDEPSMLDVTRRYLEHKGNFIVDTASSGKEGLEKIPKREYDAVVSDYQMPEMNGLEFLRTVRGNGNKIPFIIFTGKGREEVAIEALNAGADYYLQKGGKPKVQYSELQNCIIQAVKKKQAEKELIENEKKMANVLNFLPDATFATDTEGRVIAWNKAIEEMTGTPAYEMIGKGDYEYALPFYGSRRPLLTDLVLHEELQKEVSYTVLNCENQDKLYAEVFSPHLCGGNGAYLWFTASPLYDTEGNVTGAIESIRDLTNYKQTEGLYKTIFENTGTAMAILDDEVTISHVNEKMKELLGYSEENLEVLPNWQDSVVEEDKEKILRYHLLRRTDPDSLPSNYDLGLIRKNGDLLTVNMTTAMIPGTKKNIVSFIDITEKTKAEKKLKFTDFTVQNAADAIFWVDSDGRFISVNKTATKLLGYSEKEFLKQDLSLFIPKFDKKMFHNYWNNKNKSKNLVFEVKIPKKDGGFVEVEISVANLIYEGQKYGCAFVRDITERKKAEQILSKNEKILRKIYNSTSDVIILTEYSQNEGAGKFLEVNDTACRSMGYTREEMLNMSLRDIEAPETVDMQADVARQFQADGNATFEAKVIRKDGTITSFETKATIFNFNNRLVHLSVGRDISERKKAEQALIESEHKFREIFNSSTDVAFLNEFTPGNGPGKFIEVNDTTCTSLGYTREELFGMSLNEILIPETIEKYGDISEQIRKTGRATFVGKGIRKNGTVITLDNNSTLFKLNDRLVHLSVGRDVTEKKKAEEALFESEKRFREIFNSTSDIIFLSEFAPETGPGRFIEVNDATCRSFGYSHEELLQMSIKDLQTYETGDKFEDIAKQFQRKGRARFEATAMKKDGTIVSLETSATCFKLNNRLVHLSVGRDITERKKIENTMRTLNKKLNLLSSVTRHDISNRLGILMGFEEMLKEELDFETASAYLEPMIEATDMIKEQIAFSRTYELLGKNSPKWQMIKSVVSSVVSNLPGNNIKMNINTGTLEICADNMLEKVFYNLFENAIRHGGHVTGFNISFYEKEGTGILVIEDNGKGVADDIKEKIFEHGFGNNTGLGLFLTREILDITGISISEAGKEGSGARFEIAVPKGGYRF